MCDRDGNDVLGHKDWIRMFRESVDEVREEMKGKRRGDEFIGTKVNICPLFKSSLLTFASDYILLYEED